MNKNIVLTALTPHPPIIVPEVGKGEEVKAQKTIDGMNKLSEEIVSLQPETVVIVTPHSQFNPYFFSVYSGSTLKGNFGMFRAAEVTLEFENDIEFLKELELKIKDDFNRFNYLQSNVPLDHGSMVPLYYLSKAGYKGKIAVINYNMLEKEKHILFGEYIAQTAEVLGRKTVFIASGDLSHRLIPAAPAGYEPEAKVFDELINQSIENGDYSIITGISQQLRSTAGECAYNSLMVAFGVINKHSQQNKIISYEAPFGVGYLVATL